MKNSIYMAIIATTLCLSCNYEPVGQSLEDGRLSFIGSFKDLSAAKADVPDCSPFTPNEIYVRLLKPINGSSYAVTSPIVIENDLVYSTTPMVVPEGDYIVVEVSLRFNGVVTHTVPHVNDSRWDFARYVNRPVPYNITITPNQTTTSTGDELLCYDFTELELTSDFEWVGTVGELVPMYYYIPDTSCIQMVTLEIDFYRIVEIPVWETGLFSVPIPKEFGNYRLNAYLGDYNTAINPIQWYSGTEYNPDGFLDLDDVLFFDDNCN